jgi:beta-glucosidase
VLEDYVRKGHIPSTTLDCVQEGDLETMSVATDFLGINYYSRAVIRSDRVPENENAPRTVFQSDDKTDMDWEVAPESLTKVLERVHRDYAPPALYVTENGCAYATGPDAEGRVLDTQRSSYFESHIAACHDAIERGVPLKGYFAWSLLDNFEWAWGYEKRFGLVWVDYETQQRVPKASAWLYRRIIAQHGVET